MLSKEKLKEFQINEEQYKGCPLSLLLFDIVVNVLARAKIHVKKIKGLQIGKEKVKYPYFQMM